MKTLDEVITALDNYLYLIDADSENDVYFISKDALHYLKEYRDRRREIDDTESFCKHMMSDLIGRKGRLGMYERNDPLTWDELKEMIGKPVWVERDGWKVIRSFETWEDVNQEIINFTDNERSCRSVLDHGDWQAYRKERE